MREINRGHSIKQPLNSTRVNIYRLHSITHRVRHAYVCVNIYRELRIHLYYKSILGSAIRVVLLIANRDLIHPIILGIPQEE